jgi:hypothetical protein
MTRSTLASALFVSLLAGCSLDPSACPCNRGGSSSGDQTQPVVNLQVTDYKDAAAFEKIIGELEARGISATVLVDADFATENCERLRALDTNGFEIMAFARPEDQDGQSMTLSMLTYQEQEQLITGLKSAIETCLGKTITGFRCTRFDQNDDTYAILDSLGFEYNLGFVAQTDACLPGHEADTAPYAASGHDFWVVPMHSAYYDDEWVAFCDNPFRDRVDDDEWGQLLKSEFDSMRSQGRPLLVEVHPYFSGVDEGRFNAFVSFLDYAVQQNARFISVADMVQSTGSQDSSDDCLPCNED